MIDRCTILGGRRGDVDKQGLNKDTFRAGGEGERGANRRARERARSSVSTRTHPVRSLRRRTQTETEDLYSVHTQQSTQLEWPYM